MLNHKSELNPRIKLKQNLLKSCTYVGKRLHVVIFLTTLYQHLVRAIAERRADTFACKHAPLGDLYNEHKKFSSKNQFNILDTHPSDMSRARKIEYYYNMRAEAGEKR